MAAPPFPDFRSLIQYLLDTYHPKQHGHNQKQAMADVLECSPSLVYHWLSGFVKTPEIRLFMRLCRLYRLDPDQVWLLLRPRGTSGANAAPLPLPRPPALVPITARQLRRRGHDRKTVKSMLYDMLLIGSVYGINKNSGYLQVA